MSWHELPVTQAQLQYIEELQDMSEYPLPQFLGTTRGEASDYIEAWVKVAHERIVDDNWGDQE